MVLTSSQQKTGLYTKTNDSRFLSDPFQFTSYHNIVSHSQIYSLCSFVRA
jgi:hypothetical protein